MKQIKKILVIPLLLLIIVLLTGCEFNFTFTGTTSTNKSTSNTSKLPKSTSGNPQITEIITTITTTIITESTTTGSSYKIVHEYYNNFDFNKLESLSGANLINYIKSYISIAPGLMGQSYGKLRQTLLNSDQSLTNSSKIVMFYSREEVTAKWDQGATWNREHVYPKSIGGFTYSNNQTNDPIGWDIHHVRPSYTDVNEIRGNSLFGTVSHTQSNEVRTKNGTLAGWTNGSTFEPIDSVKGDVARICFYVSVMYYMEYNKVQLSKIVTDKTFETILAWNELDPVDEYEIQRNNYGYSLQGNRNIFIDYPEIAYIIWG